MNTTTVDRKLSIGQAAQMLGMSKDHLRYLAVRGLIKFEPVDSGRTTARIFKESDLKQYALKERKKKSNDELTKKKAG